MIETIIDISKKVADYLTAQGLQNVGYFGFQDNVILQDGQDYIINVIVPQVDAKLEVLNQGRLLINIEVRNLADGQINHKKLRMLAKQVWSVLPDKIENIYIDRKNARQMIYPKADSAFISLQVNFSQQ